MTGKRASDSVGKCPPLSEEVLDRAVEAAMPDNDYKWPDLVRYLPLCAKAMAPVIAEAAYRAGIEKCQAELRAQAKIHSDAAATAEACGCDDDRRAATELRTASRALVGVADNLAAALSEGESE